MPNQSIGCSNKLDAFFKQWWDTSYTGSPAAGNRPQITGPGLAGGGFYDANGGCSDYGIDVPGDAGRHRPGDAALTLGTPATFGAFTPGVAKDYTAPTTAKVDLDRRRRRAVRRRPERDRSGPPGQRHVLAAVGPEGDGASPVGTSAGAGALSGSPLTLRRGPTRSPTTRSRSRSRRTSARPTRCARVSYSKTLTFTLSTTTP